MKQPNYFPFFTLLALVLVLACKKDMEHPASGSYKGTVQHKTYRHPDVVNAVKDTLYTDVTILVAESNSSTPKVAYINFGFSQSFNWFQQVTTLPVDNNHHINYYTTTKGSISSSQWIGQFAQDSLQLFFRHDDHRMFVNSFTIKAQKQ